VENFFVNGLNTFVDVAGSAYMHWPI